MHAILPIIYDRKVLDFKDEEKTINDELWTRIERIGADFWKTLDEKSWGHPRDLSLKYALKDAETNGYTAFVDAVSDITDSDVDEYARIKYENHIKSIKFDEKLWGQASAKVNDLYKDVLQTWTKRDDANNIRVRFIDYHY